MGDHVAAIYAFAKQQGYNITSFSTADRHNKKGAYSYVELSLVIDRSDSKPKSLEEHIAELEADLENDQGDEAQKEEV